MGTTGNFWDDNNALFLILQNFSIWIFYLLLQNWKKKTTTLKKEKFENSLLHGKDKDLEVREIKSIAHFF